jgi:hypothetical protein
LQGEKVTPNYKLGVLELLSNKQQTILNSLTWAWVFGGMGWWNDSPAYNAQQLGLSSEFDTITNKLYDDVISALMYCIND